MGVYRFALTEKGWDLLQEADVDAESVAKPSSTSRHEKRYCRL